MEVYFFAYEKSQDEQLEVDCGDFWMFVRILLYWNNEKRDQKWITVKELGQTFFVYGESIYCCGWS